MKTTKSSMEVALSNFAVAHFTEEEQKNQLAGQ